MITHIPRPKTAHAPHPCPYKGETHLCFFQGQQHQGFARGHGTILDKHYRVVRTIESSGAGAASDMHEFRLAPFSNGTSALMTVYQPRQYDLTLNPKFRIHHGMGWVVEGVFQEVEIETGKVIFEWRSSDHLDPSLSYTYPASTDTSGDGLSEDTPWDYFHINSIDKNVQGDYLISARHMGAIYKISGKDGHIMWEMGGRNPTFNQTNFKFSSQHHARWISENATHTVISFFDNASNAWTITNKFSHGYLIAINHIDNTATMTNAYGAPDSSGGLLSGSQGNMQVLPDGNVHIGWGEHAIFSEHTPDGSAVQYGQLAQRASNVMVYRSYKFNWTGMPVTKPSIWTYARSRNSSEFTAMYVSWNGATEVASWNFYIGASAAGPFELAGHTDRTGFETTYKHRDVVGWAFAEALDANGRALERSVIAKTFIPSDTLRPYCTEWACDKAEYNDDFDSHDPNLPTLSQEQMSPNRGFNTAKYYAELPDGTPSSNAASMRVVVDHRIDIASLLIGFGLAVVFGVGIVVLLFFLRSGLVNKIQPLNEKLLGKYARVRGEEEEDNKADTRPLQELQR